MQRFSRKLIIFLGTVGCAVLVAGLAGMPVDVFADGVETAVSLPTSTTPRQDEDDYAGPDNGCRRCHGESEEEITFPSGEILSVHVDLTSFDESVHGQTEDPIFCSDCHRLMENLRRPHAPIESFDLRGFQVEFAPVCEKCHETVHPTFHPGMDRDSSVLCTDCHGWHDVAGANMFLEEGGTAVCIQCHSAKNIFSTDPTILTNHIQQGFFTDETPDDGDCLACHSQPDLVMTFENGDTLPITIIAEDLHNSVHGAGNQEPPLACTDCHTDYTYPHEPLPVISEREYHLYKYRACANCHEENYESAADGVHGLALADGVAEAAVCSDCHGAHDTAVSNQSRQHNAQICQQCHSEIFNAYTDSVHGNALLSENNPDVPTCITCHGIHDINDPHTALARLQSPQLCAECHANGELMAEYNISTTVFDTYVADFHGTTVMLFERQDSIVGTNKAVCYDCHGIHDIKSTDDPHVGIKNNLLATCQECHPDATANFSDAWMSHFQPSLEHNPLVYLVNLFYQIVIPLTIGFFTLLILTDIYRQMRAYVRRRASGRVSRKRVYSQNRKPKKQYPRFRLMARIEHLILLISFTVLAVTGLPQKYAASAWGEAMIIFMGGIEQVRLIHHYSAFILAAGAVYHLFTSAYRLFVQRERVRIMLMTQDARDLLDWVRFNLGLTKAYPKMAKFNFGEKIEYWAVVWGTAVMGITGFMLLNPIATTAVLPGQFILAAKAAHSGESVLAVFSILTWHMHNVLIKHRNFSIFTGKLPHDQMKVEHALELARLEQGESPWPKLALPVLNRRRRIFIITSIIVGGLMIAALAWAFTFEETAITTIPRVTREVLTPLGTPGP